MLDDLRNSSFEEEPETARTETTAPSTTARRRKRQPFLGMTSSQRFVLSLMLFFMVCIVGALMLVIFEKVVLPF